jgi:hypothetical protein
MDVEQLHIVLQQSFSADAAIRNPAEKTVKNLKNLAGAVQLLLQVAAEKQVRAELIDPRQESVSYTQYLLVHVTSLLAHTHYFL